MPSGPPRLASFPRAALAWAWVAYTAFVVYGSLVPWRFRHREISEAAGTWMRVIVEHRGLGGPTDWATNVLLFIPLGLLTIGALWRASWVWRAAATALTLAFCAALTSFIEFVQLFVPGRTTSFYDIEAEIVGAAIGIAIWWAIGERSVGWLARTEDVVTRTGKLERALVVYTVLLFAYQLLPLDLTISPGQLWDKWKLGRIVLVPFALFDRNWAWTLYGIATDIALWIPVGVLAALWRLPFGWVAVTGLAVLLEGMQLLVFSRVSDINDVMSAAVGAWAGIGVTRWWRRRVAEEETAVGLSRPSWVIPWALAVIGWMLTVIAAYWYPFNFEFHYALIRARLEDFTQVPLHAYYWSTELTAVSEILRKLMFFAPGGALLALPYSRLRSKTARVTWTAGAAMLILALAFGIELGQVALPDKIIDSGDPMLQALGGFAGWYAALMVLSRR